MAFPAANDRDERLPGGCDTESQAAKHNKGGRKGPPCCVYCARTEPALGPMPRNQSFFRPKAPKRLLNFATWPPRSDTR